MMDGLTGKVAGADISSVSGTPGGSTKVVLRGYGVIGGGNNQPLYVIDGIPLSDATIDIGGAGGNGPALTDYGNGMTDINPNDIESITVLKGTSASSLYGSLAKNGVILSQRKKGKPGKLTGQSRQFISMVPSLENYLMNKNNSDRVGEVFQILHKMEAGDRHWMDKMHPWGATVNNSQLVKPFAFQDNSIRDFYDVGTECKQYDFLIRRK